MLLPGQRFDTVGVPPLIDGVSFGALIGDTAFDSNACTARGFLDTRYCYAAALIGARAANHSRLV